jgi:hypothetical protein
MRKSLLMMSAAALCLALPAMAQDNSSSMKSPPAPNSGQSMPQPTNSMPAGGATATSNMPAGNVGTMPMAPPAGMGTAAQGNEQGDMTGMQPMRRPHRHMAHRKPMNREAGDISHQTGSGPGEPESRSPSNIDRADTRGELAAALPMPAVRGDSPNAYLAAADRALARHQGGEAQEALERAETRMLDRSVPAGQGNMPERDPRLTQVHDARMALANHDWNSARQSIQQAMNTRSGMGMNRGGMGMNQGNMGNMNQGQMMGQPAMQPGMTQPGMNQGQMMNQPGMTQPGMNQGNMNNMNQPSMNEPGTMPPPSTNGVAQ